ncbi:hypothetical protein HpCK35_30770 [Helicobacter pylori]
MLLNSRSNDANFNPKNIFLNTELAISYKTSKQNINSTKNYHADELIENIHYFYDYEQTKGGFK